MKSFIVRLDELSCVASITAAFPFSLPEPCGPDAPLVLCIDLFSKLAPSGLETRLRIANNVAGLLCRLTQDARAEIFLRVLDIEFAGDHDAVTADNRRAPRLLNQHRFRFGTQRPRLASASKVAPRRIFARAPNLNRTRLCVMVAPP